MKSARRTIIGNFTALPKRVLYLSLSVILVLSSLIWWLPRHASATTDTFTSNGNWTVPAGVSSATFEAWGGGGAGGGTTSNGSGGSGGAGGQYAVKNSVAVNSGDVYTVTVAASVSGSTGAGAVGNDSQVANPSSTVFIIAKGGAGGAANTGAAGSGSTTGGVGDTVFAGGSGATGGPTGSGGGGGGAGSSGAGGSASGLTAGSGTSTNGGNGGAGLSSSGVGNAGNNYGGGGAGAFKSSGPSKAGGNGAPGLVTVTYTVASYPGAPTLSLPSSGATGVSATPQFQLSATDPQSDYVDFEIQVCSTSNCSSVVYTACEVAGLPNTCSTTSQTGWSGQDANTSLAYNSGTTATYTYQGSTLTANTQYWWRAYAIDPGGSNTSSSASSIQSFTTNSAPNAPSLTAPSSGATGVSATPSFTLSTTDTDTHWFQTGSSLSITGSAGPALAAMSSSRVAYYDSGNGLLKTYDFSGTTWSQTGSSLSITATGGAPALAALTSTRIAYFDSANKQLRTYDWSGSSWSQTGSSFSIASAGVPALAGMSSSRVAYIDAVHDLLQTYDFSGTTWSQTGSSLTITSSAPASLAGMSSSRVAYYDSTNKELRAYDFSGTTWSLTGSPLSVASLGNAALAALSTSRVAFIDSSTNLLRNYDFNGSVWSLTSSSLSIPSLSSPALAGLTSTRVAFFDSGPSLLQTYDYLGDSVKYRLYLYQSDCSTPVGSSPFDQTTTSTGWDNGSAAYTSGATATYTYQGTLSPGTTYCWKADAIDPSGSNTYSSASSTLLFTTAGSSDQLNIGGGVNITGGTNIY